MCRALFWNLIDLNTVYSLKSIWVLARTLDRFHLRQTLVANTQTCVGLHVVVIKVLFTALISRALLRGYLVMLIHRGMSSHPVSFREFARWLLMGHWVLSATFKPMVLVLESVRLRVSCQVQTRSSESLVFYHTYLARVVRFFDHSYILCMRMLVEYLLTHQIMGYEVAICSRNQTLWHWTVINLKRI